MNILAKEKILSKMLSKGMITDRQYRDEDVSDDSIEMYVRGVVVLDGGDDVEFQIKERERLMGVGIKSGDSDLIRVCKSQLKKLRKVEKVVAKNRERFNAQVKMSFSSAVTQKDEVRLHLEDKGYITSFDAFSEYGIQRLSSIIFVLRKKEGMDIETVSVTRKNRYNNLSIFAKYVMVCT